METAEATISGGVPKTTKNGKPIYIEYTNSQGQIFKTPNWENEQVVPNEGIVEYQAFKTRDFERLRDTSFECPMAIDKATGVYYGIFNGFSKSGDPKWQRFPLRMINIFDRSIPAEAKRAYILSKSYLTEGSPNAVGKLVKFRVVDKEKVAHEGIKKIKDGKRALEIAEGLYSDDLYSMARNLGIQVDNMSLPMVTHEVLSKAQENPTEFLRIAEHPNREAISILNKALATRVIEEDMTRGYTYQGAPLGHNFDFAVKYLIDNRDIAVIIDAKSKERIEQGKKASTLISTEKADNPEMEVLKKRLADAEAKNEELLANRLKAPETKDVPLQAELDILLVTAKELKLRGLHMYKPTPESIAKLKEAIASKK